jgi:HSP20 family protein
METQFTPRPNDPQPFLELLRQEMERVIDRLRFNPSVRDISFHLGVSGQMVPAINLSETDQLIEVTAEVPGVDKDKIDITISGDQLVLKGEKPDDRLEKDTSYHLLERNYGKFQRTIPLGFVPEGNAVKAIFDNGVLKLTVRKPAQAKPTTRKVPISDD